MPVATTPEREVGRCRSVAVGGRAVLSLTPLPGRIRVRLIVAAVRREVDLTSQPSAAVACVDAAARDAGVPVHEARVDVRATLEEVTHDACSWRPVEDLDAVAEVGGASFPVLGAAYDRGAATVPEVPRWAVAALATESARDAARVAFGARATRAVVRQLASTLSGGSAARAVGLAPLGLALAGRTELEPDQLVRVLRTVEEVEEQGPVLSVDELAACTTVVRALGARRGERVLRDAAGVDGTRTLLEVARLWPDVASRLPVHPPARLVELADRCRALVVTDPGSLRVPARRGSRRAPRTGVEVPGGRRGVSPGPQGRGDLRTVDLGRAMGPQQERRPTPPDPPRRIPAGEQGGLYAPRGGGPVALATVVPASPRLTRLDGWESEGLRFSRARTCGDLERWGRMLRCCVGAYGPATVAGLSELLAIYRGVEIRGCLELTPAGTIRQLLGPANRAVDAPTRRIVLHALVTRGGIDPDAPGNRAWYHSRG